MLILIQRDTDDREVSRACSQKKKDLFCSLFFPWCTGQAVLELCRDIIFSTYRSSAIEGLLLLEKFLKMIETLDLWFWVLLGNFWRYCWDESWETPVWIILILRWGWVKTRWVWANRCNWRFLRYLLEWILYRPWRLQFHRNFSWSLHLWCIDVMLILKKVSEGTFTFG